MKIQQNALSISPDRDRISYSFHEAKYFRHLLEAYRFGARLFKDETCDYFTDRDSYDAFNRDVIVRFLENTLALFPGARHLILREPHLTLYFAELAVLLPEARFVCIVRDPRDMVASMRRVGQRLARAGVKRDSMASLFNAGDVGALCDHILSFYAPLVRNTDLRFKSRLSWLRYEDLVQSPEQVVEQLRAFTGLELTEFKPESDPDLGKVDYQAFGTYHRAWKTEHDGKKISTDPIGSYRKVLRPDDIAVVESKCRKFMERFGYAEAGSVR